VVSPAPRRTFLGESSTTGWRERVEVRLRRVGQEDTRQVTPNGGEGLKIGGELVLVREAPKGAVGDLGPQPWPDGTDSAVVSDVRPVAISRRASRLVRHMSQARLGSFTGSFALPTVSGEGNAHPGV